MNVALICPPHLLEKYGKRTKYHLVLPHLIRHQKYLDFYQIRSSEGDFVILDNGAAEGLEYGAKHLLTLGANIEADEIVVPDTIGDANDTLAKAQYFARYADPAFQYMFVLQGRTAEEVMFCLRALDNGNMFSYITTIGIPRHLHSIDKHLRATLAEYMMVEHFNDKFDIHFLGANKWSKEIVYIADLVKGHDGFRGIDTSYPIYMGLEGKSIKDDYIKRPDDFFTRSDDNPEVINDNIDRYLDWANYETSS